MPTTEDITFIINQLHEIEAKGAARSLEFMDRNITRLKNKFEELGWKPKDWSDLWRTELRDRISLLDQPREVIGLTLKKMGFS